MLPQNGNKRYNDKNAGKSNPQQDKVCDICGGLGWISPNVPVGDPAFGKLIPCPHRKTEQQWIVTQDYRSNLGALRFKTLNNFLPEGHAETPEQRESLRRAIRLVRRFIAAQRWLDRTIKKGNPEPESNILRYWLLIQGGYGCGKTHLAAAIANACLDRGVQVMFVNVPDLLDHLRNAYSPNVEESYDQRFASVRDTQLLILDDLGTQNTTPWAEEKLYQILNTRYVEKRPTVITTNLDLDDLDPRLRSRLSDMDLVRRVMITAPDFRRTAVEHNISSMSNLMLYSHMTFESFDLPRKDLSREFNENLYAAKELAISFAKNPYNWLVFTGGYGVGKTHLAAAIANYRAQRGYQAFFVVVPDLLDHLRAAFGPDSRTSFDERFEEARTTHLLILDDLGTESATPWAREKLYQIINHRYVAHLPTVITTSLSPKAFDQRILTRIYDETICTVHNIVAPSYRRSKIPIADLPEQPPENKRGSRSKYGTR
jgi:DNA replication protein DnaC